MFKRTKVSTGALLALGVIAALPTLAQEAAQRVEVTGTNIRRVQSETASPILTITADDIQKSGKPTVGDFLQSLTVDGAGSVPSGFGNGFATGAIGVSLRGLGAGSTLVLMNGRRIAPYGLADDGQKVFTDLSVIPSEAVQRVEILKDGASAIYGSDAIAGVVNIVLKPTYNNITAKVSYGATRYNDNKTVKASVIGGFGDYNADRFNVYFTLDASKIDGVLYKERDREYIGKNDTRLYGYDIAGSFYSLGGYITPAGTAATSSLVGNVRDSSGIFHSLPGCANMKPVVTPADPSGGCLWLPNETYSSLLPKDDMVNLFGRGSFNLGSGHQAYVELGLSKKSTWFQSNPSGVHGTVWGPISDVVNSSAGAGATVLAPTHPDNTLGIAARLRYASWDVGPRITEGDNKFSRILLGVKGQLGAWDYEANLMHSQTSLDQKRTGYLRRSTMQAALSDTASSIYPWRIGDDASLTSAATYAAISPTLYAQATSKTDIIDVRGSRDLMDLPGGSLGLAVGAEYRKESSRLTPTTYTDVGDIVGLGYSAYDGKREVIAGYAELLAPIHKTFEVSAALRADKYRGGDSPVTPKLGMKYTPIKQFAIRGTYAEGFRAPNPAETNGSTAGFVTFADPVRCAGGAPVAGAAAADCRLSLAVYSTPSPNLKPERSKNFTLGLVFDPTPSTHVAVDLWQIRRTNEINQMTAGVAIDAGLRTVRSDNDLAGIPNSGTLLAVNTPYVNSASTVVRGIDFDVVQGFKLPSGMGDLKLDLQYTHLEKFRRTEADGTVLNYAGTHGNCDTTNCIGTPRDRVKAGATWNGNGMQVALALNYIGSMKNIDEASQYATDGCNNAFADGSDAPGANCRIGEFYTFDLSARYAPTKNIEVFGSILNLLDAVAPFDPHTYGAVNFNPLHASGAVGRTYTVGLKMTF